jgi:DNA primase
MNITDILDEKNITYRKTNNAAEIKISCTSGEHIDKDPSLVYNIEKDIFQCWSCGFKGVKRKFLKSIGINTDIPFDSKQPFKIQKLKNKLNEIMLTNTIEMPIDAKFINGTFRGIKSSTLEKFQAFFSSQHNLEDYICFPVYQFGKLKFIEGRNRFPNSSKPKYYRRPTHSKTVDILYPLDLIKDKSSLIIVEGIFDMINMWDKGYENTVCTFGVNNFNNLKLELLDRIGTTFVEIFFDGDTPGRNGAKKLSEQLDKRFIQSKIIELPDGMDPGNLTQEQLYTLLPRKRNKN